MSNTKWTDKQLLAIEEKGTDLLVSAAAGSGKTAVLTERIIRQLTDVESPVDVTDFLIVTFTVSATSELREKLTKAIRETHSKNKSLKRLKRQILNLPSAKILTIDSFCKYVVTECVKELGIPADFRTGEENELNQLTAAAISETIDMFFEGYQGEKLFDTSYLPESTRRGFLSVVESFTTQKSLDILNDTVVDLYDKLTKYPDPMNRAKEYLKEYDLMLREKYGNNSKASFFDTKLGIFIVNEIKETAKVAAGYFEEAEKLLEGFEKMAEKYQDAIHNDVVSAFAVTSSENSEVLERLSIYSPISLSRHTSKSDDEKEAQEKFQKLRKAGKDLLTSLKDKYPISDEEVLYMQIADTFSIANELFSIVVEFHKRLTEAKFEKKIFSFDDIAQFAYKALVKEGTYNKATREFERTDYAYELGEKFHEILIDEYQDVNELQDTIFRAVSNSHNRFMVGDLKQSIYKFRGATPEIFFDYRNSFSPIESTDGSPRLVALQNNFRSDRSVIDFVNSLFSSVMNYCNDNVYRTDDHLVYSPIPGRDDKQLDTEVTLVENDTEFEYIADRIMGIVHSEQSFKFGDICILARKHSTLQLIQKVLSERNIPSDYTPNENFFGSYEIQTIHGLLKAIDNPTDDVALLSALTCPVFSFTPSELLEIRRSSYNGDIYFAIRDYNGKSELKKKCENAISKLKQWRSKSGVVQSDTFIWWLYNQTHLMSFVKKLNNGDERRENLLTFYGIASKYEEKEFKGITRFLAYLDSFINSSNRLGKKETVDNAVHLMTVHDSKGLEFPVCFFISPGSLINRTDERKKIVMSETFGPTFSVPMGKLGGKIVTYAEKAAIAETRSGVIDEELRLLYVALTRAKNHLIITGETDLFKFREYLEFVNMSKTSFAHGVKNATTLLRVIGAGAYNNPLFAKALSEYDGTDISVSENGLTVNLFHEYQPTFETNAPEIAKAEAEDMTITEEEVTYALQPISDPIMTETPYKISVSSIREGLLDEGAHATVITTKRYPEFKSLDAKNSGSFIGTSMHVFMQFCSFENCVRLGTMEEAERLEKYGFISSEQKNVLNHLSLSAFFKSRLYKEICASPRVEREKRYTLLLPSSRFYSDEEKKRDLDRVGNKTLIQGVIDCYFINADGSITLIDFKTDAVGKKDGEEILRERHSKQMQLYKEAIEEIEGKKVSRCVIYSFNLSKEIEI